MRDRLFEGAFAKATGERYAAIWRDYMALMQRMGVGGLGVATPDSISVFGSLIFKGSQIHYHDILSDGS